MLMKPEKKNMAALIISKISKKGENESEVEAPVSPEGAIDDMEMDDMAVAADEVFAALEAKDKSAFIDSLKSMIQMCMDNYESSEEKSEAAE